MSHDDEFFVGYLPTPPRTKRFALATGAALLLGMAGTAAGLASVQRAPADALARSESVELEALFVQRPYPHVRYRDEEGRLKSAMVVRGWKAGLGTRYEALDGQRVQLRGRLYRRAAWGLLVVGSEVTPDESATPEDLAVAEEDLGAVTLRGELEDSKCFYGQMRPGDGRAHKACAQLCVGGGIPPVLVTEDAAGREHHYVVSTEDGDDAIEGVLPFLTEPVEVEGRLIRRGDLLELRARRITRL